MCETCNFKMLYCSTQKNSFPIIIYSFKSFHFVSKGSFTDANDVAFAFICSNEVQFALGKMCMYVPFCYV